MMTSCTTSAVNKDLITHHLSTLAAAANFAYCPASMSDETIFIPSFYSF